MSENSKLEVLCSLIWLLIKPLCICFLFEMALAVSPFCLSPWQIDLSSRAVLWRTKGSQNMCLGTLFAS